MSTRVFCSFVFLVPLLACGGHSDVTSEACPPGFVCTPIAIGPASGQDSGYGFGAEDSGASESMPGTQDASSPSSPPYPEASAPPTSASVADSAYDVVDAKLSLALSSLVIVSDSPVNAMHLYDFATGADSSIALPTTPVAVAVDATGLLAAVAYDAHVSWVDLQARSIKATCDVSSDATDVALTKTGIAYVAPETDQWVSLHAIDLTTCTETTASQLYAGARLALHPSEQALFATQDSDPSSILRCDLAVSPVDCEDAEDDQNWGTYDYGNSVWTSADGTRLYTGGPATLLVPADAGAGECTYGGSLTGVTGVQSLSEASQVGRVALVPSASDSEFNPTEGNADTVVRVHETQYLGLVGQYELPTVPIGSPSGVVEHGRFVFSTSTMDALYVIVQADGEDGGAGTGRFR